MDENEMQPGWSNGVPAEESKQVAQAHQYEPGWSNRGAVVAESVKGLSGMQAEQEANVKTVSEAETKVVEPAQVEDKAVKAPAKKAAPAKRAAKKTAAKG